MSVDERAIANVRAEWNRSAGPMILLETFEIEALLAAAAERDELKRERTSQRDDEPDPYMPPTDAALRDFDKTRARRAWTPTDPLGGGRIR